jgi:hypothetical protein
MNKLRYFTYTKDNGEISDRAGIIVAAARDNTLMYDVSKLTDKQKRYLVEVIIEAETYRDDCLADFEAETGIKLNSLWRSFKPGGINWEE